MTSSRTTILSAPHWWSGGGAHVMLKTWRHLIWFFFVIWHLKVCCPCSAASSQFVKHLPIYFPVFTVLVCASPTRVRHQRAWLLTCFWRVGTAKSCPKFVLCLLNLIIIHPSSHRHQPRRNCCVFSCKIRLGFISTVHLHVMAADPGEIVVFCRAKCAWPSFWLYICISRSPTPQKSLCFSMKNARCTNPPRFLMFSQVKCVLRPCDCKFIRPATNRSRIPYLFSTKTCVAETLPDSVCFLK